MGASNSRVKFQDVVHKLTEEQLDDANAEFWTKLWALPTTAEEVISLIQVDDVRILRRKMPDNLCLLIKKAVQRLAAIVRDPAHAKYNEALNCVRLLTRLVSFSITDPYDELIENLFWSQADEQSPLAEVLVLSTVKLLFMPDFTVSGPAYSAYQAARLRNSAQDPLDPKVVYEPLVWFPGVVVSNCLTQSNAQLDRNRVEVLKLLLVCMSETLFHPPEEHDQCANHWLRRICEHSSELAPTLFYSLLNTVLTYDPVGWGVPYAGAIVADDRELLVDSSIQVLIVLLDYGYPERGFRESLSSSPAEERREIAAAEDAATASFEPGTAGYNVFRYHLRTIGGNAPRDLQFLYNGFSRLLNNLHESHNTYLPNSIKKIKFHQELLVLLWKALDENRSFLETVLKTEDSNRLLVPLLYLMYDGRKDAARVGLIHICTFIILLLSGEREFGVALNKPFDIKLPTDLPLFTGTHADLLIVVLHKLVVNGYEKLSAVYNCFLTIIANISPYCKKLGMVSAVRLLRLFKIFSSPRFLLSNPTNHIHIALLLDTFNNVIQYQYEGNQTLVYAIMQEKKLFFRLRDLALPVIRPKAAQVSEGSDGKVSEDTSAAALEIDDKHSEVGSVGTDFRGDRTSIAPSGTDHKFVPTEEWLASWKSALPLSTVLRLLQHMEPLIDSLARQHPGALDEPTIMAFLQNTTLVGLLPVPHPIVIRKYQPNQFTNLWFTTFAWGVVFLRNQDPALFDGTAIKLFVINVL